MPDLYRKLRRIKSKIPRKIWLMKLWSKRKHKHMPGKLYDKDTIKKQLDDSKEKYLNKLHDYWHPLWSQK